MEQNFLDPSKLNQSSKKVYDALIAKGLKPTENSVIAFMFEEHETTGYILFNFVSTDIYFDRAELDPRELQENGIHYWGEWFYGEKQVFKSSLK